MTLKELGIGQKGIILSVGGSGALRQHFLDMGLIRGAEVTVVKYAPMGDPIELKIHGYELTIRLDDAEKIEVKEIKSEEKEKERRNKVKRSAHPGYGEGGKYHKKETENPLKDDETLTFALVGNQNCGKTTLFNQLTGASQHVGNFPGVTVDRKDGVIKGYKNTLITDLPGIYSMSPYSSEEIVTREFLLNEKPKGIINIVDATNMERNLYLTMQLMELDMPMVVALNMMDELRENGGSVHVNEMEEFLGVPVVPISAAKGEGIEELVKHAVHVAKYQESPQKQDFCADTESGIHRGLHAVMHLIDDHAQKAGIPLRFAASKIMEGDKKITEKLDLSRNEKEMLEHIVVQTEEESGFDRASAVADMRFSYITEVCETAVVKPHESKERLRSKRIDRILTGKYTGIPAFIAIMGIVFWLTFNVIGAGLQSLLETGIGYLTEITDQAMTSAGVNTAVHSLVIDGIFNGVGGVLSFLPIIVTLFFFLSLLEDSGYMARVAFIMDKLLRKLGLSGRSIVPMLVGFGCTVPGVMASRTLPSERDRKMTILLTPFMSCSAKLPIYVLLTAAFFDRCQTPVIIGLYVLGIAVGLVLAFLLKLTAFRGEAVPFVMELPNYRLPGLKNVWRLIYYKAKYFITKAFTIIFVATVIIWFLQTFDSRLNVAADSADSILCGIGSLLVPLFEPLGISDWRLSTAFLTGFAAKESVVSTISVLLGGRIELLPTLLTPLSAFAFLVFSLLYTPCVAAIATVKKELGGAYAVFIVALQCIVAWLTAFAVYRFGMLF